MSHFDDHPPRITSVAKLQEYLHLAMQLEHATLPPYLTALYSIKPGTNLAAVQALRIVAVEEMLHLSLAANLLNAVGGKPDLTAPGFMPTYPTPLPDGETDFVVDLRPFTKEALETFLKIERPAMAPADKPRLVNRTRDLAGPLGRTPEDDGLHYWSIGEFYREIEHGLGYLFEKSQAEGWKLFCGEPGHQVTPEYYYSAGGRLIAVTDMPSARRAIELIVEQGEGDGGEIGDEELAHYYRFKELQLGRRYNKEDTDPEKPSGPPLEVEWDAVYPVKTNVRLADYAPGSELHAAAVAFNRDYARFLAVLTRAYTGSPGALLDAVPMMFNLRNGMTQLMRNPLPGHDGLTAGPTYEVDRYAGGVAS